MKIEAYYIGFTFPEPGSGQVPYATLHSRVEEGGPTTLILRVAMRDPVVSGLGSDAHHQVVTKLLEEHLGAKPSPAMVASFIYDEFVISWARITPAELDDFCGQRELVL